MNPKLSNEELLPSASTLEYPSRTKHGTISFAQSRDGARDDVDNDDKNDEMSIISSLSGFSGGSSDMYNYGGLLRFNRTGLLYGRSREVSILLDAFTRVRIGPSEVVLVSGEAGAGKSKVAESLRGPVTSIEFSGYFIAGKYDQLRLNEPFSAIVNAFNDLAEIISLTEGSQSRRSSIKEALGDEAYLLCKLIPNISYLLGQKKIPAEQDVGGNMMNVVSKLTLAFRRFVGVVATKESPLCIFLDDIQWADQASMQVIRGLITDIRSNHVLLVLAYRENDLNSAKFDEFFQCSEDEQMVHLTNISIDHLDIESVHDLIRDQLKMTTSEESMILSECIWKKTLGNPFFVLEFLDELLGRGFMVRTDSSWLIDLEKIQTETNVSVNVVNMISEQMKRLHPHVRAVLTYAAYLGFQFRRDVLEAIVISEHVSSSLMLILFDVDNSEIKGQITHDQYHDRVSKILDAATAEGIIEKCDDSGIKMKFVHDYPQTVLYNSIPEGRERAMIHLTIGSQIRKMLLPKCNDFLFPVVHHLNHASQYLVDEVDCVDLSQLNLDAAKVAANEKSAFLSASEYLRCGIQLLDADTMWSKHYDLCLRLFSLSAEIGYCIGDFQHSDTMAKSIVVNARTIEDKASAYYTEIDALNAQAMPMQSIDKCLSILQELRVKVKKQPTIFALLCSIAKTKKLLHGKSDNFILSLPLLEENAQSIMITTVLSKICTAAYFLGEAKLYVFAIQRLFQLLLQKGISSISPFVIAGYGMLESKLGNSESAYRFGMLALKLLDKQSCQKKHICITMVYSWTFNLHGKRSLTEVSDAFKQAQVVGAAQGDMEYASIAAFNYISTSFYCGCNLQSLEHDCKVLCENMQIFKQDSSLDKTVQFWWTILSLVGGDHDYHPILQQSGRDEAAILKRAVSPYTEYLLIMCRISKLVTAFHLGSLVTANDMIVAIEKVSKRFKFHWIFLIYKFYSGLTFFALASTSMLQSRTSYRRQGENVLRYMRKQSNSGCVTATLFVAHLEAEQIGLISRDTNKVLQANEHAIHISTNYGFINYEGLANERAYFALHALGFDSRPFFERAIACFKDWGAEHKVHILESNFNCKVLCTK